MKIQKINFFLNDGNELSIGDHINNGDKHALYLGRGDEIKYDLQDIFLK